MHQKQKLATLSKEDIEDLLKVPAVNEPVSDDESNSSNQSKASDGGEFSEQGNFSDQSAEVAREKMQLPKAPRLAFLDPKSKLEFYSMPSAQKDATQPAEDKIEKVSETNSTSNKKKGKNGLSKNSKSSQGNQQIVNKSSTQSGKKLNEPKNSKSDATKKKQSGQRSKGNEESPFPSSGNGDLPLALFELLVEILTRLEADIKQIRREINHLKSLLEANSADHVQAESLADRHGLELPLKTEEDFQKLEKCFESNSFSKEFKQSLTMLMDHDNVLTKTIANILRRYLSRDVAVTYVAKKPTKDKKLFKDTCFCKKMHDAIASKMERERKAFTDKAFYQALGQVLTNSKDWEGHRQLRKKVLAELDIPVINPEDFSNNSKEREP
ncbi:uncharacterized protein LOC127288740 [Leptopilina boulardi]|uniref:uncharacterized protein LOC127288740 n=1 Tax=Leptopilina boulardi TaxID=63433 RepID=UPI0021F56DEA|nr:uncharacterized protein LOC127288740 [Leptopilina boulardi]